MRGLRRGVLRAVVLAGLVLLVSACARGKRVPVTSEPELRAGSTTLSSLDIITASKSMADGLQKKMAEIYKGSSVPTIAILKVRNETRDYIDTDILTGQMRQQLMQNAGGKIAFLDRQALEAITKEREAKRKGAIGSTGEKVLLGADYFLTGALRSIDKVSGSKRFTYTYLEVHLTDAESSQIVWQESYEVKKEGRSAFYDR